MQICAALNLFPLATIYESQVCRVSSSVQIG